MGGDSGGGEQAATSFRRSQSRGLWWREDIVNRAFSSSDRVVGSNAEWFHRRASNWWRYPVAA